MIGALITLIAALAFAAAPFIFPDFNVFSSTRFPVPQGTPEVQPASFAFGIWWMIFSWLVFSAAYGLWLRARDSDWQAMRPPLVLSLALGVAWLPVGHSNPLISLAMIWAMWLTATSALFRAPEHDRLLAAWPVGLYSGWLSAAACIATGLTIAGYGLLEPRYTALLMMGMAIGLAAAIQLRLGRAPTYGAAVMWALYGIYEANKGDDLHVSGMAIGGVIGIAALTALAVLLEWRRTRALRRSA